ncbi:hypothetical protein [Paraclostridium sordellii]|uniref:hypothetical protein n=1 Tax=Paraclostridium sordellii TaxID=1505 RepID=UPI0005DE148A|nr:hypothetical protein [Paeniclostridium sordellii]CEP43563.1 Uncharacterised protein [[Clostridium] sordellii] [Paeniclostridium sordellii]CEP50381.1 Uncharacterised protein [[Clostridium] sordellii] [Paeniclostridium sordellii]
MIKTLPMLISYILITFIWYQLDKYYFIAKKLDDKIKSKIKLSQKKNFYWISSIILSVILILIASSITSGPNTIFSILFGFILSTGMSLEILIKNK